MAHLAARRLVPASVLTLLLGMALAANAYHATHPFHANTVVLSDYQNHEENPAGFGFAVAGTSMSCLLLLPVAWLFWHSQPGALNKVGACAFGAGATTGIGMAWLDLVLDLYNPIHIFFAMTTMLGILGGLACLSVVAAVRRLAPGSAFWLSVTAIHCLLALFILELLPLPARSSGGFLTSLGARELAVILLMGAGASGLVEASAPWGAADVRKSGNP